MYLEWDIPDASGSTRRTAKSPALEVPPAGEHIWDFFWSLSSRRSMGPSGSNPLGPVDIWCWCRLMRMTLNPQEVLVLAAMDSARQEHYADKRERQSEVQDVVNSMTTRVKRG